jgi:hypothetical protein
MNPDAAGRRPLTDGGTASIVLRAGLIQVRISVMGSTRVVEHLRRARCFSAAAIRSHWWLPPSLAWIVYGAPSAVAWRRRSGGCLTQASPSANTKRVTVS